MKTSRAQVEDMWAHHSTEWRHSEQVASQWREASAIDPRLLRSRTTGDWWGVLDELKLTLLVTREYEHLVMAASAPNGRPRCSFFPTPHPSGLAVDRETRRVFLASTRNPNQVFILKPVTSALNRLDMESVKLEGSPLIPTSSAYYPGSLYIHDLGLVDGRLYANAAGHNAVVRLEPDGNFKHVWWPRCVEAKGKPVFGRNHIQLNSIAAGKSIEESFFTASSTRLERLRPGHLNYPVDGRGVVISGRNREPVCSGLTRPHSARLWKGNVWLANSGYGQLGMVCDGRFEVFKQLPGWTRGLCIVGHVAFIGTSRVIPKYAGYAPGLNPAASRCAVHAICTKTGRILGAMEWPLGNQIFAIDWIGNKVTSGFIFEVGVRNRKRELSIFYSYLNN